MRLRLMALILTLALSLLAAPVPGEGQKAGKVPRVGILWLNPLSATGHLVEAFRDGLRELGYVEGQNITIEFRSAEGKLERLPDLAAELVRLKVDIIMTATAPLIRVAQQATKTIPIVMGLSGDPVRDGFVASLARPGGNITGLSTRASPEIWGKQLEFLKEVVPKLSQVAVLWNPAYPGGAPNFRETKVAVRLLGAQLLSLQTRDPNEFEGAFQAATQGRADGLIVLPDLLTFRHRTRITALAGKNRLPAVYGLSEFVRVGGLMSYGAHIPDLYRRAATYVHKILKGAKPADLPVEQPTKFELVINMKTAKALGLTIPPSLLFQADRVIR